jgi:cell wall-associated NlpC family hydrolase
MDSPTLKPVMAAVALAAAIGFAGLWAEDTGTLRTGILDTAKKHIGDRYNYGGMGAKGFDCSGFVQFVYRENGITLPRSTVDQYEGGRKIGLDDARPGDLVFFKIYKRRISHVGIFIDKSRFIHAPSWGKRVGIADMNLEYWQRSFVGAVTYIDR